MAEKATVFQTTQIGVQTAVGTAVPANKVLGATELIIQPRNEAETIRPLGMKYPTGVSQDKEWGEVTIGGKPAFQDLCYILSGLVHYSAPAQVDLTTAYTWTFGTNTTSEDVGKYFTLEQGDSANAWQIKDVKFGGVTLNFSRSGIGISGTGYGSKIDTTVTKTATPTVIQSVPIAPAMVKLYMADTQAALAGATAYSRSFSLDWNLTDKFALAWPIGSDPFQVEGVPTNTARLTVATDTNGMALVGKLRDGSTKWFRIQAIGPVIDGAITHKLTIDFPAKVAELGDMNDQEKVWVIQYGLQPVHDATWTKALDIQIVTDLEAL
ncbi:MAG: hypothetical protein AAGU15_09020 [Anaerolineaceae bacterium]